MMVDIENIEFRKWMPLKVKRKRDGKVILAAFHQWLCSSIMLWDGENQYLVKPSEDEITIPSDEEAEYVINRLDKQRERMFSPLVQKETPKPTPTNNKLMFKLSEVVATPTVAESTPKEEEKKEEEEPKVMSDFELLTADIETI